MNGYVVFKEKQAAKDALSGYVFSLFLFSDPVIRAL